MAETKSTGPGALLLTPGAGATRDQHTLVAVDKAVAPLPCRRVDFPYRLQGRRVPDKAPVAIAHLIEQAAQLTTESAIDPARLVLGGRSYGGRMCSMAVAQGLPAAGLILLSYPLHPPGKPANLRTEHFPGITVPVLLISGRSDPFGSPAELSPPGGHSRPGVATLADRRTRPAQRRCHHCRRCAALARCAVTLRGGRHGAIGDFQLQRAISAPTCTLPLRSLRG